MKRALGSRIRAAWRELAGVAAPGPRTSRRARAFAGAGFNRLLEDWVASCISPDEELRGSIRTLRARARELVRNNPYVEHYSRLLAINVVGPSGFRLQVKVPQERRQAKRLVENGWQRYVSGTVTVDGETDGVALMALAVETAAIDGECFLRRFPGHPSNPFRYALQFVDADLVDETMNRRKGRNENEVRMGVEVDGEGRRVAYWLRDPSATYGTVLRSEGERVPAEQMFHLYIQRRPNQTRGLPWVLSAMIPLRMVDRYEESEAVAARIAASKMVVFEPTEDANLDVETGEKPGGEAEEGTASARPGEEDAEYFEANPGSGFKGPWGHKVVPIDWQHPSGNFNPFRKGMLQKSGTGLGTSYPSLANDPEGVNYSSLRGFLLLERDHWLMKQGWLVRRLLQPWYAEWLPLATLAGAVPVPAESAGQFLDARFLGRGWPWTDPLKDVVATKEGIRAGLTSQMRDCASRGEDFEEILEELAEAARMAAVKGVTLDTSVAEGTSKAATESDQDGNGKPADQGPGGRMRKALRDAILSGGNE